jgi:hypothetical protein
MVFIMTDIDGINYRFVYEVVKNVKKWESVFIMTLSGFQLLIRIKI